MIARPIPASHIDLVERPLIVALATTIADGTPQVTPTWFHYDGTYMYVNSAKGRLKDRAMRAHPYVGLMILDPDNPYRYLAIRGPVVEITETGGREHIDMLARRYTGADRFVVSSPDEVRVIYKIAPEHILTAE